MSNLLFDERPLVLQPRLAFLLGGSDEAIILQQVHYWTQKNMNIRDGFSWVYNSMKEWHKQFYWISESSVKRIFTKLEKLGVLITGNYNKAKFDKTKWYRIDYNALDEMEQRLGQFDLTSGSKRPNGEGQVDPTYTIDYTENTTESRSSSKQLDETNAFVAYQLSGATLSGKAMPIFTEYVSRLGNDLVCHAIDQMSFQATRPNFSYLQRILDSYENAGITTVEQAVEMEQKHKDKRKQKQNNQRNYNNNIISRGFEERW